MSLIEVRHLSKIFTAKDGKTTALKEINLCIERGWIFGIIGMSGAGKSTLVRCLNYLEVPTTGRVFIESREIGTMSEKEIRQQRSDISMIFQHFNLLMQKNVLDNVCFPLRLRGMVKEEARAKARELLMLVDLLEKERAYPAQLSGGQKQRVAIARALATEPKILLCDEATSALDPQTSASILELLKDIHRRLGITMVIITHQMQVVREICTHVAVMDGGRIVEQGTLQKVFENPQSAAAKYLKESHGEREVDIDVES